jgi:hypothetical protein
MEQRKQESSPLPQVDGYLAVGVDIANVFACQAPKASAQYAVRMTAPPLMKPSTARALAAALIQAADEADRKAGVVR